MSKNKKTYSEIFNREALVRAYYDCRKRKRNTAQALDFEFMLEKNLTDLYYDIKNGTYKISRSICFVVQEPKLREVWAGSFRDRIVHHLIYNAIFERFSKRFILDTYSCLPGRGTLFGANRATEFAKKVSRNYTIDAYFLKADISSYFNSINKNILFNQIKRHVEEKWLIDLIEQVIYHDPRTNVLKKSSKELFDKLPKYKSLYYIEGDKGLPIGNLTSQFFSNIYLDDLDQFVKHVLKCKYYGRYVDDIILFHKDAGYLNWAYSEINKFLIENLELHLNHKKKIMNKVDKGFDFIGYHIEPNHRHIRRRTVKKAFKVINHWKNNPKRFDEKVIDKFVKTINSYLGLLKHVDGYNLRKDILEKSASIFTSCDREYRKMKMGK